MAFRKESPADEFVSVESYRDDIDGKDYRLPNNTTPLRYDVSLTTNVHLGEPEFTGVVRIRIEALENTQTITLQYRQLTIETIAVYSNPDNANPTLITGTTYAFVEDLEFLVITTPIGLALGQQYRVDITYRGLLRDDNMGFYRSSYKDTEGRTNWIATTQFEQTDARHAFPCYDEPQIRTPFGIEITHGSSYNAISNMPVLSRSNPVAGLTTTKFQDTPKVQTYLVAFIVSNFVSIGNTDDIQQRVFAKPQSINNNEASLALDAGKKILEKFIEHLGVEYQLPKLDQAALPDFDAGAMENWGLVTYREEYLLYNEALATTRQRENILTIIAHEYAHQWFGNHVAPRWWSYLWLNEGFATLYENYLASLVYPEDRLMDTFVIDTVQSVLDVDANPNIRPMTYYVENPDRITGLFDRVAYDKSGSVLRMMQVALGVETWTKGLKYYLDTKKNDAATSDDLYAALQTAVNEDVQPNPPSVSTIMRTWENQAGYPLITVSRNGNQLNITQERFYYTAPQTPSSALWWVPINYVVGSNPNFTNTKPDLWLQGQKNLVVSNDTAPKKWTTNDWVVVNIQESSYYRVNYDESLWNALINQLNGNDYEEIHLLNRAQLVDDSLNLARAGIIDYSISFRVLEYLSKEADYIPWASANRGLTLLNRWLSGTTTYANYQSFVRRIVEPLYKRLGVEVVANEPKLDRYGRNIAINLACQAGLESCLTDSAEKLRQLMTVKDFKISPDLQSAIYCNALRTADSDAFFFLQNKMLSSEDQAERTLIIAALGCSQDETLLKSFLNLAITPGDALRLQEKFRVFAAPANNGELGLRVLMNFVEKNFHAILAVSPSQVSSILSSIAARIASETILTEFKTLLALLKQYGGISATAETNYIATAEGNIDWQKKNLGPIGNYFINGGTTTTGAPTTSTTDGAGSTIVSAFVIVLCSVVKYFL